MGLEKVISQVPGLEYQVLLDAPCSAFGLRPQLFTGEVDIFLEIVFNSRKAVN
ncbi:hypothetical protein LguiA_007009 [Lonicera macranthoides]